MTKAKLQKQIDELNYQHIEYCKIANQRNIDVNEKLNRLIDYLGLEEKSEEYIEKECNHDCIGGWVTKRDWDRACRGCPNNKSVIKTKKYFVQKPDTIAYDKKYKELKKK